MRSMDSSTSTESIRRESLRTSSGSEITRLGSGFALDFRGFDWKELENSYKQNKTESAGNYGVPSNSPSDRMEICDSDNEFFLVTKDGIQGGIEELSSTSASADVPLRPGQEVQVSYDSHGLYLTFGIEFEFIINHDRPEDATELKGSWDYIGLSSIKEHIENNFVKNGLKAMVTSENPLYWQIDTDGSIDVKETKQVAIEIASPAYYLDAHALAEVAYGCELLTSTYSTAVDKSCGLHVHIGYGTNGYQLSHVQNLFAFAYAFGDVLATLHPGNRRSRGFDAHWCQSIRKDSRIALDDTAEHSLPERPWTVLESIYSFEDLSELVKAGAAGDMGKMAYRFAALLNESNKVTVEFRQHEATLDGQRATMWIRTVAGITEAIKRMSMHTWLDFLEDQLVAGERSLNAVQLLLALGLQSEAAYYAEQLRLESSLPEDVEMDSDLDPANGEVGKAMIMPLTKPISSHWWDS